MSGDFRLNPRFICALICTLKARRTMRDSNRLTAVAVTKKSKPGLYGDGHGLYLRVAPEGTKSWIFRFMRAGQARKMGLGALHTISLAEARELARSARRTLLDGDDPIEVRRSKRQIAREQAARAITFQECGDRYTATHEVGWKNEKHRQQWRSTLASYAYPVIGDLSVAAVDTTLVVKVLEPIWIEKPETAGRLRGRIERVLDWATARGFRSGDNPARWRGHLDRLFPSVKKTRGVKHHPAIPYAAMPAFMAELRTREGISARALEWTILTAVRTGEAIGARWSEIELASQVWTIPGERMKAAKEHRVPLCARAFDILETLPREGKYLFPGARKDAPLSNMAMLELMRGMRPGYVPHGCRSTFRDWAADTTSYPNHVVEMALAHTIGDRVEAAYRRGNLFEKRRRLMADWSRYCASEPASDHRK
jgi:integrase